MERTITLGSRGSQLALCQAQGVAAALRKAHPDLRVELLIIKTSGDRFTDVPLSKIGGKGLFVKEIEEALREGRIDLAVHSMKDVPAELAPGLALGAVTRREDPRDALLLPGGRENDGAAALGDSPSRTLTAISFEVLREGARLGTSSLRRRAQVLAGRPDLTVAPLRGNLDTRLRKLRAGEVDAVILAAAGLHRLGWREAITAYLDPSLSLPAIGQGALGIEVREEDAPTQQAVRVLHDAETASAVRAERALLRRLSGSCQVPIAGYAVVEGRKLRLRALLAALEGAPILAAEGVAALDEAEELGARVGEQILAMGGRELLAEILAAAQAAQR
ncbi:MAG: hydroxymethylbilane synthase [Candidatus Tectomicrobia bacterium]|nr:hydroxymethylbilane synthase [Candidatus Tectomicrobia bacterium]